MNGLHVFMVVDRTLVLMARRPILGQGKRRLAAEIGDCAAHRFQRVALGRLLQRLGADPRWRLCLAITPDEPAQCPSATFVVGQGEGDLGQRMTRLSARLGPGPLVYIGSDTPDVATADIEAAFEALETSDAVVGPALDGGYWLIGFSQAQRQHLPFKSVRWSTPHARADTVINLSGKRVIMLRELEDVDGGASYRRWRRRMTGGQGA
ncbi:MAG: glycosyltransferase [Hyphomonadaceae bacterium JAD_PAG50586_4]|nr:MAG: glycosyltransferase [Hyphomonadaceae bacterium JAD_PAG50586_4]